MKTIKGHEAIKIAEQNDVFLYDLQYRTEVTAEQAKDFVKSERDVNSFAIQNWPDTDAEADKIVLREFQTMLREKHLIEARVFDVFAGQRGALHVRAAELAARRLAKQGKLEIVETNKDYNVYHMPRTVGFHDDFLDKLRSVLCDECAELDLEGAFHEACLMNLMDFFQTYSFSPNDIIEMEDEKEEEHGLSKLMRPGIGMGWLSKTKSKWKNVIRPVLGQDEEDADDITDKTRAWHIPQHEIDEATMVPEAAPQPVRQVTEHESAIESSYESTYDASTEKHRITKDDLIQYLQSVEILDNVSEIRRLQRERSDLIDQIDAQERETERMYKQKQYAEQQCQEMQRDMDILIQAMQITKRRVPDPVQVVDATFDHDETP